ncbi:hypothetical protein HQQ81_04515 [Microbacteriaceae bacterium VKM Ac-2854]|nr:hypothetical protein [Microbacteriaceae bacterium VKM Ac-2854]
MDEDGLLTALPGSTDPQSGRLRLTAFVTPRLDAGGGRVPLAEYPVFADWAAATQRLALALEVDAAGFHEVLELEPDPAAPPADPGLWHALFDAVEVGDGGFQDLSGTTVASFPAAAVAELIRTVYATVAEDSHDRLPPARSGPLSTLHPIGRALLHGERRGPALMNPDFPLVSPPPGSPVGTPGRYVDRGALPAPTTALGSVLTVQEAMRFYERPGSADPLGPDVEPPPPERPALEFHGFVSALADYPELLRRLGLALDYLVVEGERIPEGEGRVRLLPRDAPADWIQREGARPWTGYEFRERRFIALPRDREGELADGSLRVDAERLFLLEQIDLDGAALKVANTARSVVRTAEVVAATPGSDEVAPSMTADAASLPALRGAGLTLYRRGRAGRVVAGWDEAQQQEAQRAADAPAELRAEEVTRGYRVDVAEESAPDDWRSLHQRTGDYRLRTATPGERLPLPVNAPLADDEGYLKAASASRNAAEPTLAYLHEAVAGWEGWSLAAQRPGNRIGLLGVEPPLPGVEEPEPYPLPLEVLFRPVRGSLPRLRFGRRYRMRARLVDMAGRSVPSDFLDPQHVTPFTTFFRWDPVPAPAVVPRRPFTEGESLLRMVIRSTLGVGAEEYAALARIVALPGHEREDLAYRAANERHLAAPQGSQQLAELHGRFDDALHRSASAADRDAAFAIAARSSGTFLSPDDAGMLSDGKEPPRPIVLTDELGRLVPHQNLQQGGSYVLHDVDALSLPYLPDPLALGVSFTSLPGDGGTRVQEWPSAGAWHDRDPIRLRIEDGAGAAEWDADRRLLRVFVPQADHAVVALSSVLPKDELELMGVWGLEAEPYRQAQEEDAVLGRHWLLTPAETLELVHAVEKPLAPPELRVDEPKTLSSGVFRFPGETAATLAGIIRVHAKSTGRLDVEAAWEEPVDDVTQPAPETRTGQAHVGDFLLDATEDDCRIGGTEYAPTPLRPATHLLRHEFGDTKHRWVDYSATATTRFREYFPPAITDRLLGGDLTVHPGPTLRLNVPSSHRPDPPQVEYVVPTWTWSERSTIGARTRLGLGALMPTRVRSRTGGGLRVYLGRPWYSSGADELLGVVVPNQPWLTAPIDTALLPSPEALQGADLAAERLRAAGAATLNGSARLRPSERLLNARAAAPKAAVLGARIDREDAQLSAHLAVLAGVGAEPVFERHEELTGALELFPALLGASGPLVSRWGSDPAWASPALPRGPYVHQFALRSAVGTGIAIPGQSETGVVVGHQPAFDAERGLWYCDLQLDGGSAYQPFVDLALVRYQPHSISGYHASAVVKPGFTQLLPDRTAALTPLLSGSFAVSVRGPSGYNALGQNYLFGSADAVIADASRQVVALWQRRPHGSDEIAWADASAPVTLHASGELADLRWHAIVPPVDGIEDTELRLLITEHELFETDASQAETWISRPAGGFGEAARKPAARRLVFAVDFVM